MFEERGMLSESSFSSSSLFSSSSSSSNASSTASSAIKLRPLHRRQAAAREARRPRVRASSTSSPTKRSPETLGTAATDVRPPAFATFALPFTPLSWLSLCCFFVAWRCEELVVSAFSLNLLSPSFFFLLFSSSFFILLSPRFFLKAKLLFALPLILTPWMTLLAPTLCFSLPTATPR